jgi:hypothetical protein
MYRDSPQGLQRMDYCNEIQSFINYVLSNPRNISGQDVQCNFKLRIKIIKIINSIQYHRYSKHYNSIQLCDLIF